jgi:hypothetical protein
MKTFAKVALWTLAGMGTLVCGLAVLVYGPSFIQPLYLPKLKYRIPSGYRGWVRFEVGNSRCLPLPREGRTLVYVVDAKGYGCTSDAAADGWRTVKYEAFGSDGVSHDLPETGWGKGGFIWDEFYRMSGTQKMNVFFVGTEQEFHAASNSPID